MFELHPVPCRPSGVDGLLGDEAVSAASCLLMEPVHSAFIDSVPVIVVVWNHTVVDAAAKEGSANVNNGSLKIIKGCADHQVRS